MAGNEGIDTLLVDGEFGKAKETNFESGKRSKTGRDASALPSLVSSLQSHAFQSPPKNMLSSGPRKIPAIP